MSDSQESWIDFGLEATGLRYVRSRKSSDLAFEGVNGTVSLRLDWLPEARCGSYTAHDGLLTIDAVVVGLITVELTETAVRLAGLKVKSESLDLHGVIPTPRLLMDGVNSFIKVELVEPIRPDELKLLGSLKLRRSYFFRSVADSIDRFLNLLVSENPSLDRHEVVAWLSGQTSTLRA